MCAVLNKLSSMNISRPWACVQGFLDILRFQSQVSRTSSEQSIASRLAMCPSLPANTPDRLILLPDGRVFISFLFSFFCCSWRVVHRRRTSDVTAVDGRHRADFAVSQDASRLRSHPTRDSHWWGWAERDCSQGNHCLSPLPGQKSWHQSGSSQKSIIDPPDAPAYSSSQTFHQTMHRSSWPRTRLLFSFLLFSKSQVSWMRKRDLHVLTSGIFTYTSDSRFRAVQGAY